MSLRLCYDSQIFGVQRYGGIARYWCELLPRFAAEPDVSIDVDLGWYVTQYPLSGALGESPNVRLHGTPAPSWIPAWLRKVRNAATSRWRRPVRPGTVLHPTYYYGFRRCSPGCFRVVTFFDLIQERFPRGANHRVLDAKREAAAAADLILCISQATADDLREIYKVSADRVAVTHLGFVPQKADPLEGRPHDRPYLLFVGLRGEYKNFSLVARAYDQDPDLHGQYDLICFGGPPLGMAEAPTRGHVVWRTGSDSDLARYYRHAIALLYTTRYEGFGLPILESMSQGCPVITTRGGSLAEVGGDAAVYVDPDDPEDLAAAVKTLLPGSPRRSMLVSAGRERAALFSWSKTAQATLAAYRSLGGGP